MAEKILSRASGERNLKPSQIVNAQVDVAMSHENAGLVSKVFRGIGVNKVFDKDKIVILFDHRAPAESEKTAQGQKNVRAFVKEFGIKHFYDMRAGICHQILPEKGHVRPGELLVGTDSHTTTHGAFGCMSTGIGATEMAAVWATGKLWMMVPDTLKITLNGKLPRYTMSKDVILHIIGELRADGADYKAVEFFGDTINDMSVASRMTMSNQAMEMGAKAAMIPPDRKTLHYVKKRTDLPFKVVRPDPKAKYEAEHEFEVSKLEPQIACPHAVDNVKPISEVAGTRVDQALLGSCTNGRLEDFEVAVEIIKGKKVHDDVRMIAIPASWEVYLECMKKGYLEALIKAGAMIINPGCGPCLGAHQGLLAPGERAISSTNRNFKGRMGSREAEVYLSSPAVVAASALTGEITAPKGGA
jgi:3-isopropylmalate/(R)-2-methylmalate dehydratase large subunit